VLSGGRSFLLRDARDLERTLAVVARELRHQYLLGYATSHQWARTARTYGHRPKLLHAQYVRPYVRRDKTDAAALLQAARDPDCGRYRSSPSTSKRCWGSTASARSG
jgi:hypothetical protein